MPGLIHSRTLAALFITSVVATASFAAQTIPPQTLPPGTRIRVRLNASPTKELVGTVIIWRNDSLAWLPQGASGVPLSAISTLEVSQGRHSHARTGALTGGAIVGFLSFVAGASNTGGTNRLDDLTGKLTGAQVVWLTAGGTAVGAGIGALIGSMSHSENWVGVPLESVRVEPVSLGRVGFRVSVRF
jgi:hypothetical protein